jgi:hypothetical protein
MSEGRPGLELMRDRTPEGQCPFCLDPLKGRRRRHCGEPECETAYHRMYQRDRRSGNLVRSQRVGSAARGGRGTVHGSNWFQKNRKRRERDT